MQHEPLAVLAGQRVDHLLVLAGAERGDDQRLGFAAGEQCRAMGPGQNADFADDRTDRLGVATVDADAGIEDLAAHDVGFQLLEDLAGNLKVVRLLGLVGQRLDHLLFGSR